MDLEFALLGWISMHQGVTGYELNRMIKRSTGYFLSASLSHIYPALAKLNEQGLVTFSDIPIKNRPSKKVYTITQEGEKKLHLWLEEPVESTLDFKAFSLKMAFAPLMGKETILLHIDREIAYRQGLRNKRGRVGVVEAGELDIAKINLTRAELLWNSIHLIHTQTEDLRIAWLKELRESVEAVLRT